MAVDNRPFKSKEQDGQGNEVIIRDQQLVEQGTTTTMPAGTYFQTLDVDGRPVKIPKDNMLNLIVEGLGIIFNGQTDQQTVTKVPTLNGNNFGASTVATLASVLGDVLNSFSKVYTGQHYTTTYADDCDTLPDGLCMFDGNGTNRPPTASQGLCITFSRLTAKYQLFFSSTGQLHFRTKHSSQSTFSAWKEVATVQ